MRDASIELAVPANLHAVRLLAAAFRGLMLDWKVAEERAATLELALVEAATNVVRHAYRDREPNRVRVRVVREGANLFVSVIDTGNSFDPSKVPPPPIPDPDDPSTWPEGGMGLSIIRAACHRLDYATTGDENALTMVVHGMF